jgi:hypothetical protein
LRIAFRAGHKPNCYKANAGAIARASFHQSKYSKSINSQPILCRAIGLANPANVDHPLATKRSINEKWG